MYYYKITNLDSRIANPDQRLTQDAEKWSSALARLYLNIGKPLLDIILFSKKLAETMGWEGPVYTFAWYSISAMILRIVSPKFGKLTAIEQSIEGEYRAKHTDLLQHSEEISFYNGSDWEKMKINEKFFALMDHIKFGLRKKYLMGIWDSMLVRYGAVAGGYTVVGYPIFGPGGAEYLKSVGNDKLKITRDYTTNSSLLINLSKAIGRIVVSYKDVQALAGYTTLIHEMDEVLHDLDAGRFRRTQAGKNTEASGSGGKELMKLIDTSNVGEVIEGKKHLGFKGVPIITPNGDVLIDSMNFEIKPGMHTMISGPNGCGKSALFRVMGQLWPLNGGKLEKPAPKDIFYIPQRPYLPQGTLRDQLIYPHTLE